MNILKRIPIRFKGELHDVRLVNFTVDMMEVESIVPPRIKVRDFNGRAMISMVDVKLRRMRPTFFPLIPFNYRHIAFRLLVEDSAYNEGQNKGIFFIQSFTDHPMIIAGGKLLTDYNLSRATINDDGHEVTIEQGGRLVKYRINEGSPVVNNELKKIVGSLDRAYSMLHKNVLRVTRIQREKWPIQAVNCDSFQNTFFKSAKLVGAFRVHETIYYDWLPPKVVSL